MNHGWEKKKIDDVCVSKKDILRASVKFKSNDLIEYVDISSIDRDKHIITHTSNYVLKDAPSRAQQVIDNGDILLSLVRPNLKNIACVSLEDDNLVASSGFCVLRSTGLLSRFLFYIVTNDYFTEKLLAKCAGAAYPAVREDDVKSIIIPVPSIKVQQQIASELDKINELIEIKRSQLSDLDLLAQSLFYEMFGDPITNPKGWETTLFGNLIRLKSGDALSAKNFCNGQYPVYGGNGIAGYHNRYNISGQNIIIGRVGALCGNVRLINANIFVTDNAFVVNLQQNINLRFLVRLLTLLELRKYANAAAQPVISNSSLKTITIPIPPLSLQNEFATKIEAIEEQKKRIDSSIVDLRILLESRIDYWFNEI